MKKEPIRLGKESEGDSPKTQCPEQGSVCFVIKTSPKNFKKEKERKK